eukprot:5702573-Pleurochrysis_carterae.AAC.1
MTDEFFRRNWFVICRPSSPSPLYLPQKRGERLGGNERVGGREGGKERERGGESESKKKKGK